MPLCSPAVSAILERCSPTHLQMLYNIPHFPANDTTAFLLAVARAKGRLRKGGVPDLDGTARSILRDWVAGRIAYYTAPPTVAQTEQLKLAAAPAASNVGTVAEDDVGGASLHAAFAPAFDLGALFGEADAVAFAAGGEGTAGSALAGGTAVKMREGAMGVESEDADVGWAVDEPAAVMDEDEDDLDLGDLVDDDELEDEDDDDEQALDEDDDMSEDEPAPAPTGVKGKRAAPGASRAANQIVSVAPPSKKKKQSKSVSFSSAPLGPTGSTLAADNASSAPSAATTNKAQIAEEAGAVSANKKAKRDAKKDKKKLAKQSAKLRDEVKQATREFGDDVELPSGPRKAQTIKGRVTDSYDFGAFLNQKKREAGADDDVDI